MVQTILDLAQQCIPTRWITDKVWAHPWLNSACKDALQRKRAAFGTADFPHARDACSRTFMETYHAYVSKTREELKKLSPSSRGWWKLSDTLLAKAGTKESIPPLQKEDDSWALTAAERAAELARVFWTKPQLPEKEDNDYSELTAQSNARQLRLPRLSVQKVFSLLKTLDEASGTGPDLLPARILKIVLPNLPFL